MKTYGQIAYEAYIAKSGGYSLVNGVKLPTWEETKPEIRAAWSSAAEAVVDEIVKRSQISLVKSF